ncbi:MAG: TetR/AcrR family transcriptional regulator [Sporichthyaceae bacterium]
MDTRQRILEATAQLLAAAGPEAVSTRDVCEAAGVTAPTIYHHFGDKAGLYDAVAAFGFESYVVQKRSLAATEDPVADLHRAWDVHVDFGVSHPALYTLMYCVPRSGEDSPAAKEAGVILGDLLTRVAKAGRLAVSLERATAVVVAGCVGSVLQAAAAGYDADAAAHLRDTVLDSILTGKPRGSRPVTVSSAAGQLAALLDDRAKADSPLRPAELALFQDWLRQLIAARP